MKSADGNESETAVNSTVHKLNENGSGHDSPTASPKSSSTLETSYTAFAPQVHLFMALSAPKKPINYCPISSSCAWCCMFGINDRTSRHLNFFLEVFCYCPSLKAKGGGGNWQVWFGR